ncbi:hypothetical protein [Sorangium sp. So ce1099]|uniref:hypothetical protein n=1 Tax=Sorangium sp. So ce1099 TaxID=3133331 RepID=UPI003F61AC6C
MFRDERASETVAESWRTTMVSVRMTPRPVRSKRIPLGNIVNAHITDVNPDRPAWAIPVSPLLSTPRSGAALPASSSLGLEAIVGRSFVIDIKNVIVHMERDAMLTTRISVFPASTPATRHTGVK